MPLCSRVLCWSIQIRESFPYLRTIRFTRTAKITKISRYYGAMGQLENPIAAWLRNTLLRLTSGKFAGEKGI